MDKYKDENGHYLPTIQLTSKPHTLEVKKEFKELDAYQSTSKTILDNKTMKFNVGDILHVAKCILYVGGGSESNVVFFNDNVMFLGDTKFSEKSPNFRQIGDGPPWIKDVQLYNKRSSYWTIVLK